MQRIVLLFITLFAVFAQALGHAVGVKEPFGMKCLWVFTLIDGDGNVKSRQRCNLIVDDGFDALLMAMFSVGVGTRPDRFNFMAIGGGNTAPAANQNALVAEFTSIPSIDFYQRQATAITFTPGSKTVTVSSSFGPGVGIGNVVEAGLFNDASAGTMFNRVLIGAFNKGALDTLNVDVVVSVL